MTTYLITGANGQVGSQLVRQLHARPDATVIAADRDTLDITDRAAVFQAAQRHRPHIIINAAAHTAVDKAESETELARAINVNGTRHPPKPPKPSAPRFCTSPPTMCLTAKAKPPTAKAMPPRRKACTGKPN